MLGTLDAATTDLVDLFRGCEARRMLAELGSRLERSSSGCLRRRAVELGRCLRTRLVASEREVTCQLLGARGDRDQATVELAPVLGSRLRVEHRSMERVGEANAIVGDLD